MRSIATQKLSGAKLRIYLSKSKSFKNSLVDFYHLNSESIQKRIDYLLLVDPDTYDELNEQLFMHLDYALNGKHNYSPLGRFVFDIVPLLEMYYKDFIWKQNKQELNEIEILDSEPLIVKDNLLSEYERYLIYGTHSLGLSIGDLGRDWYSNRHNVSRKLHQIYGKLKTNL